MNCRIRKFLSWLLLIGAITLAMFFALKTFTPSSILVSSFSDNVLDRFRNAAIRIV